MKGVKIMGWNHRVVHSQSETMDDKLKEWFEIHEVYYNDKNEVTSMTVNGVRPGGNTIEELRWTLQQMLAALDKPTIEVVGPKE